MQDLVRLGTRPSRDGKTFVYTLDYVNEEGKRVRSSLRHADKRKAERQRAQKEREIRMGIVQPGSLKLSEFSEDSLRRTRGQVRDSTLKVTEDCLSEFIRFTGNIDYQNVRITHGEQFVQHCLDRGNSPATVAKKVRHLKRVFQLAVDRGQLEDNPFKRLKQPKSPKGTIRILTETECQALLQAAGQHVFKNSMNWPLLLKMALCTGMRRGELLNLTWPDIDFENKTVRVSPKADTEYVWQWFIKDMDRRVLPLPEDILDMLASHQAQQDTGLPYLFVTADRYRVIQQLRQAGKWDVILGKDPMSNFDRQFHLLLKKAKIADVTFHDLRRTCISLWFKAGLREFDVMQLAGHSSFETTRKYYLAVSSDLVDRTRQVNAVILPTIFGTHLARTPKTA